MDLTLLERLVTGHIPCRVAKLDEIALLADYKTAGYLTVVMPRPTFNVPASNVGAIVVAVFPKAYAALGRTNRNSETARPT